MTHAHTHTHTPSHIRTANRAVEQNMLSAKLRVSLAPEVFYTERIADELNYTCPVNQNAGSLKPRWSPYIVDIVCLQPQTAVSTGNLPNTCALCNLQFGLANIRKPRSRTSRKVCAVCVCVCAHGRSLELVCLTIFRLAILLEFLNHFILCVFIIFFLE